MFKLEILLKEGIENIKDFVRVNEESPFEIDLASTNYVVDGKSMLGVLSLRLNQKITLHALTDSGKEFEQYVNKISPYTVSKEMV
jgi:phosphotransferase system HPr-like phosphotransfer protein